ncbi:MAG: FAD-dependent oxidoreductase [Thiohalomonadales bacterium]
MSAKKSGKIVLISILVILVASFFIFDLGQFFTLEYIKAQRGDFIQYYHEHKLFTIAMYFLIYIAITALSLPGATIMTLAGGGVFGLLEGSIVVSFASTIGATLAFLVSRYILQDSVQAKFGSKLKTINEGIEKEGALYLFTLRLIPLFPFFVINLIMGLTPIKTIKFYLVSQLGMLPGTIVFVNAGSQLANIESLGDILSPALLGSFALLGVFPIITKKIMDVVKARKYLRKYAKPKKFDYNMLVIGAGSAGLVSSYIAAAVKSKVALVEKHKMGGDCLNTGCVPSKALIRSAKMLNYAKRAADFGFKSTTVEYDFCDVMQRVQRVISKVEPHDSIERYTELGVDCYTEEAEIMSPYEVKVGDKTFTTKNIVVATGARPLIPNIEGLDKIDYYTSDTIWNLRERPNRLIVLGGGPIGSELAQCFQRLGVKVISVERSSRLLTREDSEVSEMVMNSFKKDGIDIRTEHDAKRIDVVDGQKILICEHAGKEVRIEFDEILIALGRQANISGFGLEKLDIAISARGTVEADEFLRTNYPNIYVCGDVTGPYQFTHVAAHQAWFVAVNALFSPFKKFRVNYSVIPWATFTDPEVAQVGLNESAAKQQGIPYEVTTYGIDDLDRAIADDEDHGLVKVLTVPGKDKIIGVTIVGTHAGDLIAEFVLAMTHGLGLNKILGTIHIYPTLAEANKYVAGNWKKNHKPETVLRWLEKFHTWRRG